MIQLLKISINTKELHLRFEVTNNKNRDTLIKNVTYVLSNTKNNLY